MVAVPLRRWEKIGLVFLAVGLVALGVLVEIRSNFQRNRKTDFGVYARAGWAVRAGLDPYTVTDDNGWHFCYPPVVAVLMVPLADPPAGEPREWCLPFSVGVAVWYLLSLFAGAFAAHRFASAVLPEEPRYSRRWWYARIGPVYVCVGGIGFSLTRGQVNLFVVALIAGMLATSRTVAGACLGVAACVKVIPMYLGLMPSDNAGIRRVGPALVTAGVLVVLVPAFVWGPDAAIRLNTEMIAEVLAPGATGDGDGTRAKELTNTSATDSQSFVSAIHHWRHPRQWYRPAAADPGSRVAHWVIVAVLTVALHIGTRRADGSAADRLVVLGLYAAVMLHATPVSHMHYYAYGWPLVAGLWLKGMRARPGRISPGGRVLGSLVVWGLATTVPLLPGDLCEALRQRGVGPAATLLLLAVGVRGLGSARTMATAAPLRMAA